MGCGAYKNTLLPTPHTQPLQHPIGIYDSGVGGLSVLRHIRAQLPHESLVYVADQAHVPYGARTQAEIRQFGVEIVHFLRQQGCKLIVVACNTATTAALSFLRQQFPDMPFVGMEPAVKPAAAQTRNGRFGVLATPGTFRSERYAELLARFAEKTAVFEDPCLGLVQQIEAGATDDPATDALLTDILRPMLANGVDTLVLGCTHYPFVQSAIERVLARLAPVRPVAIIDPAPAVARQTARRLQLHNLLSLAVFPGRVTLYTSGDPVLLNRFVQSQQSSLAIGKSEVLCLKKFV
ncbi:MAG: glutamate racemase [Anaerolineales bacterium]|nr:glutamate racemase [Anaerolineales bacterium]